jgi:hypothetical protein
MMATWRGTCASASTQATDWLCSFMDQGPCIDGDCRRLGRR